MTDHSKLAQKTLVRFGKSGPAIYHSHHDMIRFWERSVKRARLPLRLTQGFNPRPRMVFPHALGVGITSRHEAVVLELCVPHALDDMRLRLELACGDTLDILGLEELPPVKKSPQIVASSYTITGWPGRAIPLLPALAAEILVMPAIEVERGAPGEKRRLDIRPFVADLSATQDGLVLNLIHSQAGSARPDEIAGLAGGRLEVDWRDLRIEKTGMTLEAVS